MNLYDELKADKRVAATLAFIVAIFFLQDFILLAIMNPDFMYDLIDKFVEYNNGRPGLIALLYVVVTPWVAVTLTAALGMYLCHKKRLSAACAVSLSPAVAVVVSRFLWTIAPPIFY